MFTSLLLTAALLSPAAPVPKVTKPPGPPPRLVAVAPAKGDGPVAITVVTLRKVPVVTESVVIENGVPATKKITREVETTTIEAVPLEKAGATYQTAAEKPLTAAEANEKLKAGGVLVVPAPGADEVDAAYVKLFAADAILVNYKAEEKKRIAVPVAHAGRTPPPPTVVAVTAAGSVPARGTVEETVKVPVTKTVNGEATIEYVETKRTVVGLVATPFDEIKPEAMTADGKAVAAADAKKLLVAGAVVLVSADGKPVDERYRKLFRPDTLVLASEKMTLSVNPDLAPAVRGAVVIPPPAR